jgi:hypothetical protein
MDLHESIVDGDDKDLASVLKLGVCNVAGDVAVGAGWAWVMSVKLFHSHVAALVEALQGSYPVG